MQNEATPYIDVEEEGTFKWNPIYAHAMLLAMVKTTKILVMTYIQLKPYTSAVEFETSSQ